jgi:hypothetical protein
LLFQSVQLRDLAPNRLESQKGSAESDKAAYQCLVPIQPELQPSEVGRSQRAGLGPDFARPPDTEHPNCKQECERYRPFQPIRKHGHSYQTLNGFQTVDYLP